MQSSQKGRKNICLPHSPHLHCLLSLACSKGTCRNVVREGDGSQDSKGKQSVLPAHQGNCCVFPSSNMRPRAKLKGSFTLHSSLSPKWTSVCGSVLMLPNTLKNSSWNLPSVQRVWRLCVIFIFLDKTETLLN